MFPTMLGIDPSLTGTGLAVYHPDLASRNRHDPRYIICYTFASNADIPHDHPERWDQVLRQIWPFIEDDQTVAVVEGGYPSLRALTQASLASLRSVLVYGLWQRGVKTITVQPKTLKVYATGICGSDKGEVLRAVKARYGHLVATSNHNEADALTLLAMAFDQYEWPLVEVPPECRRALLAPYWPSLPREGPWETS